MRQLPLRKLFLLPLASLGAVLFLSGFGGNTPAIGRSGLNHPVI